jgi:hypothetical protein
VARPFRRRPVIGGYSARSTIFRTGRLDAASMPVISSTCPAPPLGFRPAQLSR